MSGRGILGWSGVARATAAAGSLAVLGVALFLLPGALARGEETSAGADGASPNPASRPVKRAASDTVAIGLPDTLAPIEGVRDPVFAILTGLVANDHFGTLSGERLESELRRLDQKSRLPYQTVLEVTRLPVQPGYTSRVTVTFRKPLDLAVPYSILGYHPGSFTATELCNFREWAFPRLRLEDVSGSGAKARTRSVELTDVHIFALETGKIWIDIDAVVDRLLGGAIDDTRVTVLALCRHEGEWLGVATGYGRDQKGRSGVMSLREDKILFPTPDRLRGLGRQLRGKAEALMKVWDSVGDEVSSGTRSPR